MQSVENFGAEYGRSGAVQPDRAAVEEGHRDAERNRLLRRADWRFLLPDSQRPRTICFAGGLLAEAVAHYSKEMVDGRGAAAVEPGAYDLAVLVNPSRADLRKALAALRPGGTCYAEWRRPLLDGAAAVRRRLAAAGFESAACYWATPDPARSPAAVWLPLDDPGALAWHRKNRSQGLPLRQWAAYQAKWQLWQAAHAAGLALPICSVARKPGEPGANDHLLAAWEKLGLGTRGLLGARPQRLTRLLLTGGLRSINKAVKLVFADGQARPCLALKMARVPAALASLQAEAAVLQALHDGGHVDPASVPQTLFFRPDGPLPMLGQTALSGSPFWAVLRRSNYPTLAAKATTWLVQLAQGSPVVPREEWWERSVAAHLHWFGEFYRGIVSPEEMRQAQEMLGRLGDLPLVCEQRDFSPWNVLLDGDQLVVLDWESAELQGIPLLDLVYFLTYLTLFVEGVHIHGVVDMQRVRAVYRAAQDPGTANGQVFAGCLRQYCAALGVDPDLVPALRLLAWTTHAHVRQEVHAASSFDQPPAQAWQSSVFAQLWEEELRLQGSSG